MKKLLMQAIAAVLTAFSFTGAYALTDVSYITTSTAKKNWILLDCKPNQDTIIEATVAMPAAALALNKNHGLFCARGTTTSENTFTFFFLYNSNKTQFRWDYSKNAIGTAAGTVAADTKYVITCNVAAETEGKRGFSVTAGDTTSRYAAYAPLTNFTAGNKLMLFASYIGPTAADPVATDNYSSFKVYGVRIWEGEQTEGNLKYDLRPCMDANGVYCLRDAKNPEHAPYYSEGDNDFGGPMGLLSVAVEDYVTCVPRVSLTGLDIPDVTSVEFQYAQSAEGPWTTFATVTSPEDSDIAADNAAAKVGVPLCYRAVVNADTQLVLPTVPFTRFRRLERDPANETGGLVNGYKQFIEDFCTPLPTQRMPWVFDGNIDTVPNCSLSINGKTVDQVKHGIDFGEEGVFVAGTRLYPHSHGRSSGAYCSAGNDPMFADAVKLTGEADFSGGLAWQFLPSSDMTNAYRYVWVWKTSGAWYANMAEVQFYGWTQEDLDNKGDDPVVVPSCEVKVGVEDFVTCVPHVTAKVLDVPEVSSVEIQYSRSAAGPWTTLANVVSPEGDTVAADNTTAVVGVPLYYRAVVNGDEERASVVVPFTRFRRLERDPANETGGLVNGYKQFIEDFCTPLPTQRMPLAFDGMTDTSPDCYLSINGKIVNEAKLGIDFGEEGVFVAGTRVYPWNNARSTGAYCSAGNDPTFADAVKLTGEANFSGGLVWQFLPSSDTTHAYRYVWVWKTSGTGGWNVNMAEVQFYGWTQDDLDNAGMVIPPDTVTVTRGSEVGSVVIGWSGGANIASLAIERRITGESDWTTVASGLPAAAGSRTDASLPLGKGYEYRIVATGIQGDVVAVAPQSVYLYAVGEGTGLRAVMHGPIASASYSNKSAGQCAYREFRNDATLDIDTALSTQVLYAQTNIASAIVHWRGKLIVPEDGRYTFGLQVKGKDGYSLWLDDVELMNHNCRAGKEQVNRTLTAGEHPIRIEWASRAEGNTRFLRFTWELKGKFPEEVVPASQLKSETDDAAFPCYAIDDCNFAFPLDYSTDGYLPHFEWTPAGDYTFLCSPNGMSYNVLDFGRTFKGPFRIEATFDKNDTTRAAWSQLMVRSMADPRCLIAFMCQSSSGSIQVMGTWSVQNGMRIRKGPTAVTNPVRLRIDRDRDNTLHFYYKSAGATAWTEYFTFIEGTYYMSGTDKKTDLAPLTGESLRVSISGTGDGGISMFPYVDAQAHGFTIAPRLNGTIMVFR